MADDAYGNANAAWQTELYDTAYRFSVALKELHRTNPWPENSVLDQVMNLVATELWDRCFSLAEISSAMIAAAADLPRYTAGQSVRQ